MDRAHYLALMRGFNNNTEGEKNGKKNDTEIDAIKLKLIEKYEIPFQRPDVGIYYEKHTLHTRVARFSRY